MHPSDEDFIRDIRHLQDTMERLLSDFSRLGTPLLLGKESGWRPHTDVYETEAELIIRAEIAGVNPEDLQVIQHERVLTIKGIRRDPTPAGKKHFHTMEITLGHFERNIAVPTGISIASIEAHYENGYLLVRVAKGARRTRVTERTIPVERG
jgi:HSP20 family protein